QGPKPRCFLGRARPREARAAEKAMLKGGPPGGGFGPMKGGAPTMPPRPGPYAMLPGGPGPLPPGGPPGQAAQLNELGLPIRPGAEQCLLFLNTGSCTNGAACIFDHPRASGKGKGAGLTAPAGAPAFTPMRPPPTAPSESGTGPSSSPPGAADAAGKPDGS
ncbi:unnamed protein product, partial [Prorocentrum cordatum]